LVWNKKPSYVSFFAVRRFQWKATRGIKRLPICKLPSWNPANAWFLEVGVNR